MKNFQICVLPKHYTLQLISLSSVGTGGVWREREGKPREFLGGPVGEWSQEKNLRGEIERGGAVR